MKESKNKGEKKGSAKQPVGNMYSEEDNKKWADLKIAKSIKYT